jgi:hypothetical protein
MRYERENYQHEVKKEANFLTLVQQFSPMGTCLLQESELYHAGIEQIKKCQAKEADREQVCTSIKALPFAHTDINEVDRLEKTKQLAVTTMIKPVDKKRQTKVDNRKKKAAPARKKQQRPVKKNTPKESKKNEMQQEPVQTTTELRDVIHESGCRHGDLGSLNSFTRAEVAYYTSPHRFLAGESCLDCKMAVEQMKATAGNRSAMVFYCDEGIKGFGAPDDDPMKAKLTCDLILCPACEAKRRVTFELKDSGRPGGGRNRRGKRRLK